MGIPFGSALGAGLGGLGGLLGGIAESNVIAEKQRLERDKLAQEQQYRDAMLTLERDKINQAVTPIGNLYKYLGVTPPAGVDLTERVPTAMADKILGGMQEQQKATREQDRALSVGGAMATDLAGRYGTGDAVGATGPQRPSITDPVMGTLASILKLGGYTPAALPAVEAATKYEADKRIQESQQAEGRRNRALFGLGTGEAPPIAPPGLGPTAGATVVGGGAGGGDGSGGEPVPAQPAAGGPGMAPGGPLSKLNVLPQLDAKGGLTIHTTAPSDQLDMRAIAKYGVLHRQLPQPQANENYEGVNQELLKRQQDQGVNAANVKLAQPIGAEAFHFVHKQTMQHPDPSMSPAEIYRSGQYVTISPTQLPAVRQLTTTKNLVDSIERTILARPDLWPPASGNAMSDAAAVTQARVKFESLTNRLSPFKGTDKDVADLQSNLIALPTAVRAFGDVGNIAVNEQTRAAESLGLHPETRDAALARIDNIRGLLNGPIGQAGLPALVSPNRRDGGPTAAAPKIGEPGYTGRVIQPDMPTTPPGPGKVWIKAPDGVWGKWDARQPIPQGYMR